MPSGPDVLNLHTGAASGRRRFRASVLSVTMLFAAAAVFVRADPTSAPPAGLSPAPGHCEQATDRSYSPASARVGQPVTLTLNLMTACDENPVDAVLLIDGSATADRNEDIFLWAEDLIDFAQVATPRVRLGVVEFDDVATTHCELTRDADLLRACIDRITASGGRHPEVGFREAAAVFERGRSPDPDVAEVTSEIVILILGGRPEPDCAAAAAAATAWWHAGGPIWGRGMFLVDLGETPPDWQCDFSIANRYFYGAGQWSTFVADYEETMEPIHVHEVEIKATLSTKVDWWTSLPPHPSRDDRTLNWSFDAPVPEVLTLTYRIVPRTPGDYDVNDVTTGRVQYRSGMGTNPSRLPRPFEFTPALLSVQQRILFPFVTNGR